MVGIGCWMSETEVLRLRLEVAELRALVHQLADRIAVLEASEGFEVVPPASSASRGSPEGLQSSPNPFGLGSPSGYPRTLGTPTPLPRTRQDQEPAEASESGRDPFRASVAREIGRFLGRAVRGENRGTSGRDKVSLPFRIYIVLAPFSGEPYTEPKLFSRFCSVKELCKRGPDTGRSVFVGLPSQWEALIALREAGFSWPASGIDAN